MSAATAISHTDEINARILAISEDRIAGFVRDPMREIARACGLPVDLVIERIRAMLEAGTIRRVRQTLMATDLAPDVYKRQALTSKSNSRPCRKSTTSSRKCG